MFRPFLAFVGVAYLHAHAQRLCFQKKCRVGQAASIENFQIIKYFDPNILALLAD